MNLLDFLHSKYLHLADIYVVLKNILSCVPLDLFQAILYTDCWLESFLRRVCLSLSSSRLATRIERLRHCVDLDVLLELGRIAKEVLGLVHDILVRGLTDVL